MTIDQTSAQTWLNKSSVQAMYVHMVVLMREAFSLDTMDSVARPGYCTGMTEMKSLLRRSLIGL